MRGPCRSDGIIHMEVQSHCTVSVLDKDSVMFWRAVLQRVILWFLNAVEKERLKGIPL